MRVRPLNSGISPAMTIWTPFGMPYEIHAGRELKFMLRRGKPPAHFCGGYPPEPEAEIIPRAAFAPYVRDGSFEMCAFVEPLLQPIPEAPQMRATIQVIHAARSETWRIDAYVGMQAEAAKLGSRERLERRQESLLGYTDAENDPHIEHMLSAPHAGAFPWLGRLMRERHK